MEPPEPVSLPSLNTMPAMARVPEPVDAHMWRRSAFPHVLLEIALKRRSWEEIVCGGETQSVRSSFTMEGEEQVVQEADEGEEKAVSGHAAQVGAEESGLKVLAAHGRH